MSEEEIIHALKEMLRCNGIEEGGFNEVERSILQETLTLIEKQNNRLEQLEKENEELSTTCKEQSELIEDTYINYNDLEFTRLKRRNKELEKENRKLSNIIEAINQTTPINMVTNTDYSINIDKDSIPKSVIREKIDKLKREFDFYAGREHEEWEDGEFDGDVCDDLALQIGAFKKILGDEQ